MKVVFQKFKKEVFHHDTLLTLIAGAELVSSIVNAQTLDTLVNMDIHNFFYKAICLVIIFAFYLLFTYMLIRYQAYFNQKVATWLRDRISHSIEATSYGRFYERIVKPIFHGLQVTWNRLKGMRLIQPLMLSEGLFLRSFLRWRYLCIIGLSFY